MLELKRFSPHKKSQIKVDRIADQTDGLLQEFKQVNKQIESLRVYNSQLERQIVNQKRMMVELQESIENATIIERGVSPLMVSMLNALRRLYRIWICRLRKSVASRLLLIYTSILTVQGSRPLKSSVKFLRSTILNRITVYLWNPTPIKLMLMEMVLWLKFKCLVLDESH